MRVAMKVKKEVLVYRLACDKCKRPIRTRQVRVSCMHRDKGINDRDQWNTLSTKHYHYHCLTGGR